MGIVVVFLTRVLNQILVEWLQVLIELELFEVDFAAWQMIFEVVAECGLARTDVA